MTTPPSNMIKRATLIQKYLYANFPNSEIQFLCGWNRYRMNHLEPLEKSEWVAPEQIDCTYLQYWVMEAQTIGMNSEKHKENLLRLVTSSIDQL